MKLASAIVRYVAITLSMALLSSCSLLSPVTVSSQKTYLLNTIPHPVHKKPPRAITVLVMPPESRPIYNTTQMAYSTKPYQIAYFSQNQWAETPAQMWQPLMVQTLQQTHYFHAVVTPPYGAYYDYVLTTQILQLKQDFTCKPAMLQLAVKVQISKTATNRVIATKQFVVDQPILQKTPYHGVIAANCAAASILKRIATFSLRHMK